MQIVLCKSVKLPLKNRLTISQRLIFLGIPSLYNLILKQSRSMIFLFKSMLSTFNYSN